MGPPSLDGGETPRSLPPPSRSRTASMGPPSLDGGGVGGANAAPRAYPQLQWGPRLSTGGGGDTLPRIVNCIGLDASMGPPSLDGGGVRCSFSDVAPGD